MGLPEDIEYYV